MRAADFGVFGVQNGTLCFCGSPDGNTGPGYGAYGAVNESECSSPCSDPRAAAVGALCGGVERNSVYLIVAPEQPTKGLLPLVAPYAGFDNVGCFPDQTDEAGQANVMPHFFCAQPDHHSQQQGDGGVALLCSELEALSAPQCAGSFDREQSCSRQPNSLGGRSGSYMTLELCDALCAGFPYFAVQSGSLCYCGQSYGSQGNVSMPSWCDHPCTGNSSQTCGGGHCGY